MQVPREDIFVEGEKRLREKYGNILELAKDLGVRGQLQPILVRPFDPEENPEVEDEGYQWKLVDGGRRFLAFEVAEKNDIEIPFVEKGHIAAYARDEEGMDPLEALEAEFHANDERKNFTWREKAIYIRRIHDMHKASEDRWGVPHTANALDMTKETTYKYLQITADEKIFNSDEVAEADSFRTAYKKFKILKDHKRREKEVAARKRARRKAKQEKAEEASDSDGEPFSTLPDTDDEDEGFQTDFGDVSDMSLEVVSCADCIQWFSDVPDDHFDWVHWDPPYGGEQKGGAFSSHKGIDDSWATASKLMRAGIPEIWRTLKRGHWLAIWCHPSRINWLARYLRGHEKSDSGIWCKHCGKPWTPLRPDKLSDPCYDNPGWRFWVNKYPNIWYKTNREADGHEIQRFGVNVYETFLLAAVVEETDDNPILVRNDWKNVFPYEGVPPSERRHQMHKPADLLAEILSIISVRGAYGCDPSAGGGSIIEAALYTDRRVSVVEQDEDYANTCIEVADEVINEHGIIEL